MKQLTMLFGLAFMMNWHYHAFATSLRHQIQFLDCGQGDCIFIETPTKHHMLIDTGKDSAAIVQKVSSLLPYHTQQLDLLVITHLDKDHSAGMRDIITTFRPKYILLTAQSQRELSYEIVAVMRSVHSEIITATQGLTISTDLFTHLRVLWPPSEHVPEKDENNSSIVLEIQMPDQSILTTGDLEQEGELALLESGIELSNNILKGGHHGSDTSSTMNFLLAVEAHTTIFQNGANNTYGHPSKDVISRVRASGSNVYNTSIHGTITVQCPVDSTCNVSPEYAYYQ